MQFARNPYELTNHNGSALCVKVLCQLSALISQICSTIYIQRLALHLKECKEHRMVSIALTAVYNFLHERLYFRSISGSKFYKFSFNYQFFKYFINYNKR